MSRLPPGKVKPIQEMLNKVIGPRPPLAVDGIMGPKSIEALKEFQRKASLAPSGEVDSETAVAIARAIKTGKIEKDQPEIFLPIGGGKYAGFTQKEYDRQLKRVRDQVMAGPVRDIQAKVAALTAEYEHFKALTDDQYIVSTLIEITRWTSLPKKSVIERAQRAALELEALARAGDIVAFGKKAAGNAKIVNDALEQMRAYRADMIDGGGNWVTGLEITKWASFTALSVYFAPLVGAQLGASAVATAVVGGAAIKGVESAAGEIGNYVAENAQSRQGGAISRVLIDAGVGALTGFLSKGGAGGKSIVESFTKKTTEWMAKQGALRMLSDRTVQKIFEYLMNEGGKNVLDGAVKDAAKAIKNDPTMTIDKFVSNLRDNFVKGLALGPINKAIDQLCAGKNIPIPEGDRKKLRNLAMDKVVKDLKGTTHIKEVERMVDQAMGEMTGKILANGVKKSIDKIVDVAMDRLKGKLSYQMLLDAMIAAAFTPAMMKQVAEEVAEAVIKDQKKLAGAR